MKMQLGTRKMQLAWLSSLLQIAVQAGSQYVLVNRKGHTKYTKLQAEIVYMAKLFALSQHKIADENRTF